MQDREENYSHSLMIQFYPKPAIADPEFHNQNLNPSNSFAPYMLFNVGNGNPINLMDFLRVLEKKFCKESKKEFLPFQEGDVHQTHADISKLNKWIGFKPNVNLESGIDKFTKWYLDYYGRN